jgi:hypothetical protein
MKIVLPKSSTIKTTKETTMDHPGNIKRMEHVKEISMKGTKDKTKEVTLTDTTKDTKAFIKEKLIV